MKRLLALLLFPAIALADYGSVTVDEVTSFYDGDTIRVTINEWPPVIGERIPVRIAGIQSPERRSRCDTEAEKERERELAADARIYLVERLRGAETIELRQIERGSFYRIIAEVWADGEDVGQEMLEEGYALPYVEGAGGRAWCGL
ncbi:thermonuclease family protein [Vreelandella aquamarina]|uniref:thermonuclease family protein n=1 Tax=Vreelandella aquamarina TaxID=77097 RepID=UPI001D194986|nr:thermonuclease family protein [Halomonas meridiana]MCC4289480.1 thermonuclease family protein [Halomonas meridiana]